MTDTNEGLNLQRLSSKSGRALNIPTGEIVLNFRIRLFLLGYEQFAELQPLAKSSIQSLRDRLTFVAGIPV